MQGARYCQITEEQCQDNRLRKISLLRASCLLTRFRRVRRWLAVDNCRSINMVGSAVTDNGVHNGCRTDECSRNLRGVADYPGKISWGHTEFGSHSQR